LRTLLGTFWETLEASGPLATADLRFTSAGVAGEYGPVLVGVDGRGDRHLCIPATVTELGLADEGSAGVTVRVRDLIQADGSNAIYVDVHCHKPDLNNLFELVAAEMVGRSAGWSGSPFAMARSVLDRWRELLEPNPTAALGPRQLAAILAELLVLEKIGDVQKWTGPEMSTHDFTCGIIDIEVKSSLSTTGRKIEVHGLSQLTAFPGTSLYLAWVRLGISPGRGTTVPETVGRLLAHGANAPMLFTKLSHLGYHLADSNLYSEIYFEQLELDIYHVTGEFPRITQESFINKLSPQVSNISYSINLEDRYLSRLSDSEIKNLFEAIK